MYVALCVMGYFGNLIYINSDILCQVLPLLFSFQITKEDRLVDHFIVGVVVCNNEVNSTPVHDSNSYKSKPEIIMIKQLESERVPRATCPY